MLYNNILDTIGNTPMIKLNSYSTDQVEIYAKLEGQNPGGSVKDRIALGMVEDAEHSGELTGDKTILESTSGNTGIGLAMVATIKGYRITITMSAGMSTERKKMLRAYGAELIETPAELGTSGAIDKATQLNDETPGKYWMSHQHRNQSNPEAHYRTTAEEIVSDLPEITHFIAGMGTFGTLRGIGMHLKEHNPNIQIVGVEPHLGHSIQGLRNMQEPNSPQLYDQKLLDQKLVVTLEQANSQTRQLATVEGIFAGMSTGAALWGALQLVQKSNRDQIVFISPDRGEKYLSTDLWD